ncbi:laccase-like [Schistocerca americana]|uniref:laccase-like n=1 Tax=Schistocerca americana TaxID=7009 RepID=UPI001F4F308C|nr:laccase-like [Schistocerca americana]
MVRLQSSMKILAIFVTTVLHFSMILGFNGKELSSDDYTISGGPAHPCFRECKENEDPMICHYNFTVSLFTTMSILCGDCPDVEEDCSKPGCITAGGAVRSVSVVNQRIPGPAILVCHNDIVVVNVLNSFDNEGSVIHWHGLRQRGRQYMDGVPYITQCPIQPYNEFQYSFKADVAGTHLWHAHIGFEEADGLFGAMVIRQPPSKELNNYTYDYDLPEHTIVVWHWFSQPTRDVVKTALNRNESVFGNGYIINGKGNFLDNENFRMPREVFNVSEGYRYRFRLMFNAALYCPVEVSVDNHKLLVIGSESSYFEPIEVDSFIINGGERYDFVIEANQAPGNYWMRFRGMGDCHKTEESSGKAVEAHAEAVLHYDDAAVNTTLPDGIPTYEEGYASGVLFNPVQETKPDYLANRTIIRVSDLTNIDTDSAMNVSGDPDKTVYLGFDFKSYDSLEIPGPYPQVNNVTFKYPSVPLLTQRNLISSEMFCPNIQAESSDCYDEFCNCPYVIEFDLGDLVEIVLVDTSVIRDQDHPFHMHGYHFHVVAMEPLEEEEEGPVTVGRVKEMNDNGAIHKNLETAPLKDTISVPMRGYTVIRFIADNPGYWFFHCHISNHAELGMGVVLKVGGHDEMVSIPSDFPQCGNWKWTYHEEAAGSRSYGSLLALLLCLSLLEVYYIGMA